MTRARTVSFPTNTPLDRPQWVFRSGDYWAFYDLTPGRANNFASPTLEPVLRLAGFPLMSGLPVWLF